MLHDIIIQICEHTYSQRKVLVSQLYVVCMALTCKTSVTCSSQFWSCLPPWPILLKHLQQSCLGSKSSFQLQNVCTSEDLQDGSFLKVNLYLCIQVLALLTRYVCTLIVLILTFYPNTHQLEGTTHYKLEQCINNLHVLASSTTLPILKVSKNYACDKRVRLYAFRQQRMAEILNCIGGMALCDHVPLVN